MKNLLISSLATIALVSCSTGTTDESTVKNDLRVPAYPLVTIDPYASAWSAADNLYDAPVTHWTGKSFPFSPFDAFINVYLKPAFLPDI